MTSVQTGDGGFKNCPILRTNITDRMREMWIKGGGVGFSSVLMDREFKKSENFVDIISEWPISELHYNEFMVPVPGMSLVWLEIGCSNIFWYGMVR